MLWKILVVFLIAASGFAYFQNRGHDRQVQVKLQKELSVTELPEEVLKHSILQLEGALADSITSIPAGIRVKSEIQADSIFVLSKNSPYKIECDPLSGITINFFNEDGLFLNYQNYQNDLPINPESVAGKKLLRALCDETGAFMVTVTGGKPL